MQPHGEGGAGFLSHSSLTALALQSVVPFYLVLLALWVFVGGTCGRSHSLFKVHDVLWMTCPHFSFPLC